MNIEGFYYLINTPIDRSDTWSRRAVRNLRNNLVSIKNTGLYTNIDRYKRVVTDVNHVVRVASSPKGARMSLSDYNNIDLSPIKSEDLLHATEHPDENPFFPYFKKRMQMLIESAGMEFVGLSLNYLSQALTTFAIIGFIRREMPRTKIILGGGLITSWMKQPDWKNPFHGLVDHLVAGPGELPLLNILGKSTKPAGHHTPRYDGFPLNDYLSPGLILPYAASTGCYWARCAFCPERTEGNIYCQVRVDSVSADLRTLVQNNNPALIHLVDNAISPAVMKRIAKEPPGAAWYGFARITHHLADPDFCASLKRSGCVMLKLGIESGNQDVLDYMHKGTDLNTVSLALKTLKKAGISVYAHFLFGTPLETIKEARDTFDFIVTHSEWIDFLNLAIFNLPVNSPEAASLKTKSFYDGDLSLYHNFEHPEDWGRREIRQFLSNELKSHPAVRLILQRQPPFFTSNHAPFFVM